MLSISVSMITMTSLHLGRDRRISVQNVLIIAEVAPSQQMSGREEDYVQYDRSDVFPSTAANKINIRKHNNQRQSAIFTTLTHSEKECDTMRCKYNQLITNKNIILKPGFAVVL